MGSCANTKEIEVRRGQHHLNENKPNLNLHPNQHIDESLKYSKTLTNSIICIAGIDFTNNLLDPKFKNFAETLDEKWVGDGIKRMKAFKSSLRIDQLNSLKEDYFNSKVEKEGLIWKHIRNVCLFDSNRAENMLISLKLKPLNGCMNLLMDHCHKLYPVPNYCINDPYLEKHIDSVDTAHLSKILTVKLHHIYN